MPEGLSPSPQHQRGAVGTDPALPPAQHQAEQRTWCHEHTNMEAQIKDKQLLLPDSKAHNGWKKKARGLSGHLKPPRVCPAQVTCMKTKIIGKLHVWCWKANQQ